MHFICRSFIGKNNNQNWSQHWENEPDDFQLKSTKGHLFALLTLTSNKDEDVKSIGHDLIFEINQNYFSTNDQLQVDILTSLKETLQSITTNPLYQDYQPEVILLVILNNQAFIASLGNNQVVLNRQSSVSLLFNQEDNQEVKTMTGPIQTEDRFFLSNSDFFTKITWPKIKNILSDPKLQNVEENFLSSLYSLEDQSKSAAFLLEIKEENLDSTVSQTEGDFVEEEQSSRPPLEDQIESPSPISTSFPKKSSFLSFFKKLFKRPSIIVAESSSHQLSKRKKIQISLAIFLLIALFFSCYLGYQKNKKSRIEDNYQQLKTELNQQLNQANSIKGLSLKDAQEKAKEAEKTLQTMISLTVHSDEINQFESQINTLLSQTGLNKNFLPDFFYDTANIVSNPNYRDIFINRGILYLFDPNTGRLDQVIIKNKPNDIIIKSDQLKSANNFVADQDNTYFLFNDNITTLKNDELEKKITFSDSESSLSATDFQLWNGSLYLLDNSQRTIWKFSPTASGFSQAQNWLKNDKELELGPISIDIDGEIWVLYQNGQLENYISGVKDNFSLKGDQQIDQASNLTVALEDDSFLAFLDGQNIIFVYKKDGNFIAKYNLGDLKANDLSIYKNILYILASDQKIYQIKL